MGFAVSKKNPVAKCTENRLKVQYSACMKAFRQLAGAFQGIPQLQKTNK